MLVVSFALVVAAALAGIGRAVWLPGPEPDVQPRLARDVVVGLLVLWQVGAAHAERIEHYTAELSGRSPTRLQSP
ncbi:hypothetical protein SacmaDRAFT_2100 [Saccharomonospora marina XMU15]|uniref:Uncharacterized protein n=1 Tax=Saccharomonospora marina XMU15 TaxID=882083 RepID=H5X9I9_9PSEU|nr:hypothetical protein [Saccharomonospora marina]EHR50354.1 hypothetical protein SacmaDRAFT_2100 [Saccharomonospora marina XMU15]